MVAWGLCRLYNSDWFAQDILNRVLEEGPEFSELEYMNAFQLIHRSQGSVDPSALQRHLQRLSDILGEVGVTVWHAHLTAVSSVYSNLYRCFVCWHFEIAVI